MIAIKEALAKVIIFSFFISALVILQYYSDLEIGQRPEIAPEIIPAKVIKLVDIGLNSAASSLMWIYTVQQVNYFPDKLPELISIVNNLDPKFSYPYAFSALLLPNFGFIDKGIAIAKNGIRDADPDWRIPYYLATTYHIFLKDRENAAYYFDLAFRTPGASEVAKTVAARYGTSGNYREQTKTIWQSIYETSKDEIVRENAKAHLIQIDMLELLEKAVLAYRQRYGSYPKDINDLVSGRILKAILPSPFGVEFYLNDQGRVLIR